MMNECCGGSLNWSNLCSYMGMGMSVPFPFNRNSMPDVKYTCKPSKHPHNTLSVYACKHLRKICVNSTKKVELGAEPECKMKRETKLRTNVAPKHTSKIIQTMQITLSIGIKTRINLLTRNILLFVVVNIIRSIFNFVYIWLCLYTSVAYTCRMWWNACKQTFNIIDGIFTWNCSTFVRHTTLISANHHTILDLYALFCLLFLFPSFNHSFEHPWSERSGINAGFSFLVVYLSPLSHPKHAHVGTYEREREREKYMYVLYVQ